MSIMSNFSFDTSVDLAAYTNLNIHFDSLLMK